MPKCNTCQTEIDDDFDTHVIQCRKTAPKKKTVPTVPKVVAPIVVSQRDYGANPGDATLRDIVTKGTPSETFYLAANQSLVALLKHEDARGNSLDHTSFFKNMVATILLETANRQPKDDQRAMHDNVLGFEISGFNMLQKTTQLIILNQLWESCYRRESPSQLSATMDDGEAVVIGEKGLPSSIRRIPGSAFFARIEAGPIPNAWKKWKIGFRVDGGKGAGSSTRDDLTRITTQGSQPLQKLPDLAVTYVQKYYHEHRCSQTSDLYIGYQNRDLYNESGTCVSRSLFGATAFPYRDSQNNTPGLAPHLGGGLEYQYLFAINCAGARGLDTEHAQKDMAKKSLWRPGEKAFAGFGADRILGWTRIVRMGQPLSNSPEKTGWSFKFVDATWEWVNGVGPGGELQPFLEQELATWAPGVQYNIGSTYDFQLESPPLNT